MLRLILIALMLLPWPTLADTEDDYLLAAQRLCLQFRVASTTCAPRSRNSQSTLRQCAADEPATYDSAHPECAEVDRRIGSRLAATEAMKAAKDAAVKSQMEQERVLRARDASGWVKGVVGQ